MHALRKYGVAGSHLTRGAKGVQRGRLMRGGEVGVARIPLIDYEFDREVSNGIECIRYLLRREISY